MAEFKHTDFVLQKVQTHKTSLLMHKKIARDCVEQ